MPIILALRKLRHEGNKFGACLGCTIMPCLKKKKKKKREKEKRRTESTALHGPESQTAVVLGRCPVVLSAMT
jgi:hypothetical protein